MPTNEEKREAARRLRESRESAWDYRKQLEEVGIHLFCADQADYYLIHKAVLGCLPAEHMHPCDYAELHDFLATIIDPELERTCRIEQISETEMRCSECGEVYGWAEVDNLEGGKLSYNGMYCKECGARVVDE